MTEYWYPLAVPTLGDEEIAAATRVLRSCRTTMGQEVEAFEEAFARRVGAAHGVMVNSGSSADLLIALAIDGLRHVIVPAVTWPTQVWAWQMAGHRVHLADVEGINATARSLELAGRYHDRLVLSLVHLMGVPCDMEPVLDMARSYDAVVVEDCCEALGATYEGHNVGTFGQAASWSFFFSHHITTMEGGMVTTDDAGMAERLRTLRSHGWARHLAEPPPGDPRYTFVDWGLNVRPTEVAAAIGRVQLGRLESLNAQRQENYDTFAALLADNPHVTLPDVPEGAVPAWFGLPFFVEEPFVRDDLAAHLEDEGVETRPILAGNLIRQPAAGRHDLRGSFPGADRVHDRGLYVGLHPFDTGVEKVAKLIDGFCR